ncbi:MAG TPA: PKD domain-containing protein, partial [Polyangiaceae bacterium]|nr:PKD domain-containing protein [Polyangiaceae bacterium]
VDGIGGGNGSCQAPALVLPGCLAEELCNGADDDCDGSVDEGCPCNAGAVQPCFRGAPGRRNIGACSDGAQTCLRGGEFAAHWGECTGGIEPAAEVCDGLDNDCNGCTDDLDGCTTKWTCPGPNDPRTPNGVPLAPYALRGSDFFSGAASSWSWTIQGGPCDALNPSSPSFSLDGASSESATFTPKLSGDYTVTMTVTPVGDKPFTCTWIVHIEGPGLRIEMCYPESSLQDLDLYLKQPGKMTPWFTDLTQFSTALDQCSWANCEANLRGGSVLPVQTVARADWGYSNSPLSLCENGLQGATWQSLGFCASPRLDIDNNLSEGTGVPENINVDAPRDNETFRIMVANFSGQQAHPLINVYCDGRRTATIGAPPDQLPTFSGSRGDSAIGALWRAADVTTHVSATGTTCTVNVLHPPSASTGFDVTVDDPRF